MSNQPRSKLPQFSVTSRSPSPSMQSQRIQDSSSSSSLLSNPLLSQLSTPFSTRSPSPAVGVAAATGRSPSPATGLPTQHYQSSPQSVDTPPPAKRKHLFHRELKYMMHGFGDDPNPYSETVELVEELVIQFITEMTLKALEVGKSGRISVKDIIFIIRRDKKKYSRVKDLLTMKEQIDKAKKAFSEDSEVPL